MADLLTLGEAAGRLRKTERWLTDWLRAHPVDAHDLPYGRYVGDKANPLYRKAT